MEFPISEIFFWGKAGKSFKQKKSVGFWLWILYWMVFETSFDFLLPFTIREKDC